MENRTNRRRRRPERELGDGPPCPLDPQHGRMVTLRPRDRLWCPHHDHDGRPRSHPAGALPPSTSLHREREEAPR